MPYNPSSAYPRHSTYIPPVYNRGYARGFNEYNWASRTGGGQGAPVTDIGGAIQRAAAPATTGPRDLSLTAMARRGIISNAIGSLNQRNALNRANMRKAGAGPGNVSNIADKPQTDPTLADTRGGRKVLAGINERLGAIAQREETSTAMDEVVDSILTTGAGGPAKAPIFKSGSPRRRGA